MILTEPTSSFGSLSFPSRNALARALEIAHGSRAQVRLDVKPQDVVVELEGAELPPSRMDEGFELPEPVLPVVRHIDLGVDDGPLHLPRLRDNFGQVVGGGVARGLALAEVADVLVPGALHRCS